MSTDRELLQAAAKAAGIEAHYPFGPSEIYVRFAGPWAFRDTSDDQGALKAWNPLEDDGDALRLAVKLRLEIAPQCYRAGFVEVYMEHTNPIAEPVGTDPYAATRRAIVRAAAALGEQHDQ